MKLLSFFLILIFSLTGCQNNLKTPNKKEIEAIQNSTLVLENGKHAGRISTSSISNDKNYLITSSYDKSSIVWDIKKKKIVRKFIGDIEDGDIGIHNSAIFSPDNKYVIIGGKLPNNSYEYGNIRIYELTSGKLVKIIKLSDASILKLQITKDDKNIIASSIIGELFKIDLKTWNHSKILDKKYSKRRKEYKAIADFDCFEKDGNQYIVFIRAGGIRIISTNGTTYGKIKKKPNRRFDGTLMKFITANDKNVVVTYKNGKVRVFSHNFILKKELEFFHNIRYPKPLFSKDNKKLFISYQLKNRSKTALSLFDTKNFKEKKTITLNHKEDIESLNNIDENILITTDRLGGISILNINSNKLEQLIKPFNMIEYRKVGVYNNLIALKFKNINKNFFFDIEKQKLISKKFNTETSKNIKKLPFKLGSLKVTLEKNELNQKKKLMSIYQNNKVVKRIPKPSKRKYVIAGITKENYIVSGDKDGKISIYNKNGEKIANLVGHTMPILSLAQNKNTLISADGIGIIKLWNLNEIKKEKFNRTLYPYVNIYIDPHSNDWTIWTQDVFFNSSNIDKGIAWHVDKGWNKESEIFSAKQFSRYLYRPDIIVKSIELQSREKALKYFFEKEPELRSITSAELIDRAPVGFYIEDLKLISSNKAKLKIRFKNNNANRPDTIAIFVNASQVLSKKQMNNQNLKTNDMIEYEIPLLDKENLIKVAIYNKWAEGVASTFIDSPKLKKQPKNLYILSVGINNYKSVGIPSLVSPEKDALSISKTLKKNKIYKNTYTTTLLSSKEKITSAKILNKLKEISLQTNPNDDVVVFFAGHGITNSKGYNFITQETKVDINSSFVQNSTRGLLLKKSKKNLSTKNSIEEQKELRFEENTTLDWKRLNDELAKLKGKKFLIIDSCQAGGVMKKIKPSFRKLEKDIFSTESIIMSASSSQEFALENDNNGFFTTAILNSLNKSDEKVYFNDLNKKIIQYVKEVTNGEQNPTIIKPINLNDFLFFEK